MKIKVIIAICVWLIPTTIFAADSYLCIADMTTGFAYDKNSKEWISSNIKTSLKYIIKKIEKEEPLGTLGYKWQLMDFGKSTPFLKSRNDIDQYGRLLIDGDNTMHFKMDTNNLKFIFAYMFGYWTEGDAEYDTPYLQIGKCSPL